MKGRKRSMTASGSASRTLTGCSQKTRPMGADMAGGPGAAAAGGVGVAGGGWGVAGAGASGGSGWSSIAGGCWASATAVLDNNASRAATRRAGMGVFRGRFCAGLLPVAPGFLEDAFEAPPLTRIPGEGRDPLTRAPNGGGMDPGFRRECGIPVRLQIGMGASAGLQRRPGPPRPDAGDRLVRIAIMAPADSGVGRHVDCLGALLAHDQFLGLDVAV